MLQNSARRDIGEEHMFCCSSVRQTARRYAERTPFCRAADRLRFKMPRPRCQQTALRAPDVGAPPRPNGMDDMHAPRHNEGCCARRRRRTTPWRAYVPVRRSKICASRCCCRDGARRARHASAIRCHAAPRQQQREGRVPRRQRHARRCRAPRRRCRRPLSPEGGERRYVVKKIWRYIQRQEAARRHGAGSEISDRPPNRWASCKCAMPP